MWRKFSDVWYLVTFNFICLLLQYKSKVSSWRSLQFDQGCALEAWTPLGLKMWRRKRNGRADFFRLESVRGLVRCEEKLKLRRKLRLTAPWPPDPLLKISQLLFSTGWAFHQQNPRKYLKNPPVVLMSPHITWRVHFQRKNQSFESFQNVPNFQGQGGGQLWLLWLSETLSRLQSRKWAVDKWPNCQVAFTGCSS